MIIYTTTQEYKISDWCDAKQKDDYKNCKINIAENIISLSISI